MEALLYLGTPYILVMMGVNLNVVWIIVHVWIGDHCCRILCKESEDDEQECTQEPSGHTDFNKSERKTRFGHVIAVYTWHVYDVALKPDTNRHEDGYRQVDFWLLLESTRQQDGPWSNKAKNKSEACHVGKYFAVGTVQNKTDFFCHVSVPDGEVLRECGVAPEHTECKGELTDIVEVFRTCEVFDSHPFAECDCDDGSPYKSRPSSTHEVPSREHVRKEVRCKAHGNINGNHGHDDGIQRTKNRCDGKHEALCILEHALE